MRAFAISLAAWTIAFAVLSLPLFGSFASGLPTFPNPNDSQLIVWILDWVFHALPDPALRWVDAPINHPAPGQLTGSDWFLTAQLGFAPAFLATGNAILATNLAAWLTYPLAAALTERLLRRCGFAPSAAIPAALWFALASRRVPFNTHQLQNANFLLPLVALALAHLRAAPTPARTVVAATAFLTAILSALYGALFSAIVGAVFLAVLACTGTPETRARFVALAVGAAAIAGAIAALVLSEWLARAGAEMRPLSLWEGSPRALAQAFLGATRRDAADPAYWLALLLIPPAIYQAMSHQRAAGIAAIVLWTLGAALSLGLPAVLDGSAFSFMAYPVRFQVVADLGRAIVLALGVAGLGALFSTPRAGLFAGAGAALLIVGVRGIPFAETTFLVPEARERNALVYQRLARLSEASPGAVLELPIRVAAEPGEAVAVAPDAMLGQLRHRQPLLNAYTGYHAPHRGFVLDAIGRLPSAAALDDLRRATDVRWILLRPLRDWRENQPPRGVVRAALVDSPAAASVHEVEGWTFVELRPRAAGLDWAEQIAAGRSDREATGLGYPVPDLREATPTGSIQATWLPEIPPAEPAFVRFLVHLENSGEGVWPASVLPARSMMLDLQTEELRGIYQEGLLQRATPFPVEGEVVLIARWKPRRQGGAAPEPKIIPLPRDLPPGESMEFWTLLWQPEKPAPYDLELTLAQMHEGEAVVLGLEPFSQPVRIRRRKN